MRTALSTTDLSLVESFRLALEAEGIASQVTNQNMGALPFNAVTVSVLDDDDLERALAVLGGLQRTTPPSITTPRWPRKTVRAFYLLLAALALALCGTILIR